MNNKIKTVCVLIVLLMFSACTTTQKKTTKEAAPEPKSVIIPDQREKMVPSPAERQVFLMKPVVKRLLKKARKKYRQEDYIGAVSLIERGIDISPNNPFLWQQLALIRLKQQDYIQARQLAEKSNVLGESNNDLRLLNWQIIAEAKRGL